MKGEFILNYAANGIQVGEFYNLLHAGIKHGISTRNHGISNKPYLSLNLAFHVGDKASAVIQNRDLFCTAMKVDYRQLVTAQQVHGEHIVIVGAEDRGKGALEQASAIKATDALVTNTPGVPLMLFYADCVPVLIADPAKKVVAVCHAGWKGTVARIAQKTVAVMEQHFNSEPADCLCGIGPSIGPECYEVDEAVGELFKADFKAWKEFLTPYGDRWQLDLWQANKLQLIECGIKSENIVTSKVCTKCSNEVFFSYRQENGNTGRHGAFIML